MLSKKLTQRYEFDTFKFYTHQFYKFFCTIKLKNIQKIMSWTKCYLTNNLYS